MTQQTNRNPNTHLNIRFRIAALVCVALLPVTAARADDVTRVEEDWELVLNEPSNPKSCPQFETVMAPVENLDASYARVTWNYREQPAFQGTGLQAQAWHADQYLWHNSIAEDELSDTAETITWTQSLETDGDTLRFQIINGHSTSWGEFGGDHTSLQLHGTHAHLNAYQTDVSVGNCRISYGINRVALLRIKQVRRYNAAGELVSVDSNDKVLRQQ